MDKKKMNLRMSQDVPEQITVIKKELAMKSDKDTSFDIYFDIYHSENEDYLYIKLIENSAVAPFYYNKSFTMEELCEINRIFKASDIYLVKEDLRKSLESERVNLEYDKKSDGIIMKLRAGLFCDEIIIDLPLYKEMIPINERDDKLIELYNIIKDKLKKGKELYSFLKSCGGNFDKNILNILKENFDIDDISEALKKTFGRNKTAHFQKPKKDDEEYFAFADIINYTNITIPGNSFEFKLNEKEKKSNILCKKIIYPPDIAPQKTGEIFFFFDAKTEPKKFVCTFDVYFNGELLKDTQFKLNVSIPQPK